MFNTFFEPLSRYYLPQRLMKIAKNTVAGLSNKYVSLANLQLSISFVYLQALSHWGHKVIFPGPFGSQISFLKTQFVNSMS